MTPEELELFKKLIEKAENKAAEKHDEYFYKGNILETENIYPIVLDLRRLKISLDIGTYNEYLLDKPDKD